MSDEWRVEVKLGDEAHGLSLGERLRAHDLDDEARDRLGRRVIVTRDGPELFLYSGDEPAAREAERVVGELLAAHELAGEVTVTRWHPDEQAWKDASVPLPRTEEERRRERERLEASEARELAEQGEYDWEVRVELPGHRETVELSDRLRDQGLHVVRRWRYLLVGALTEADAHELAERILTDAPSGARARIEANLDEPAHPLFVFLGGR
jgi:hypothetical protein